MSLQLPRRSMPSSALSNLSGSIRSAPSRAPHRRASSRADTNSRSTLCRRPCLLRRQVRGICPRRSSRAPREALQSALRSRRKTSSATRSRRKRRSCRRSSRRCRSAAARGCPFRVPRSSRLHVGHGSVRSPSSPISAAFHIGRSRRHRELLS